MSPCSHVPQRMEAAFLKCAMVSNRMASKIPIGISITQRGDVCRALRNTV